MMQATSQATSRADVGLIGLGVMGRNLALNLRDHGYAVAAFEPLRGTAADLEEIVAGLVPPRRVLLMVKAGAPVEGQIEALARMLEPGDIVIDGGNSHFRDTERRAAELAEKGLHLLGAGISGGTEGARSGASIMVGGPGEAFARAESLLRDIAAVADGASCCARLGPGGAGHFVKMVHNGIEYALMQAISEAYCLLRRLGGLSPGEMSGLFAAWNRGDLASYLIEITAAILAETDGDSDRPLLDVVVDSAGEKGTGRWMAATALELGVPAPTIIAAVAARALSARRDERAALEAAFGPRAGAALEDRAALAGDLEDALLATSIAAFAQGFAVLDAAPWPLDRTVIARLWRGGCIIRARLLEWIAEARAGPLLVDPRIAEALAAAEDGWRRTVALAAGNGVAAPAMASALAWFDGLRQGRGGAEMIQAQRHRFGGHDLARTE